MKDVTEERSCVEEFGGNRVWDGNGAGGTGNSRVWSFTCGVRLSTMKIHFNNSISIQNLYVI